MTRVPDEYENLNGVSSVSFEGSVETERHYKGNCKAELDKSVLQIWFSDVPLADIISDTDYEIANLYGVRPDEQIQVSGNEQEIRDVGHFNGVGFEMETGPKVYVEHPTRYTTGLGESGPAHQHAEYLLNGRAEFDAETGKESAENALEFGREVLNDIEKSEEERERKLWNEWADETGYREKGKIGRLWLRITSQGPKGLGPKHINPYSCINDLDKKGLQADQLLETEEQI